MRSLSRGRGELLYGILLRYVFVVVELMVLSPLIRLQSDGLPAISQLSAENVAYKYTATKVRTDILAAGHATTAEFTVSLISKHLHSVGCPDFLDVLAAHRLGIFCARWVHIMGSVTDRGSNERSAKGYLVCNIMRLCFQGGLRCLCQV